MERIINYISNLNPDTPVDYALTVLGCAIAFLTICAVGVAITDWIEKKMSNN
jgi:hypothetical protein